MVIFKTTFVHVPSCFIRPGRKIRLTISMTSAEATCSVSDAVLFSITYEPKEQTYR